MRPTGERTAVEVGAGERGRQRERRIGDRQVRERGGDSGGGA